MDKKQFIRENFVISRQKTINYDLFSYFASRTGSYRASSYFRHYSSSLYIFAETKDSIDELIILI